MANKRLLSLLAVMSYCCCCLMLVRKSAGEDGMEEEGGVAGDKLFFTQTSSQEDVVVSLGGSLDLTCEAGGSPRPSVHWLLNGKPVNNKVRHLNLLLYTLTATLIAYFYLLTVT